MERLPWGVNPQEMEVIEREGRSHSCTSRIRDLRAVSLPLAPSPPPPLHALECALHLLSLIWEAAPRTQPWDGNVVRLNRVCDDLVKASVHVTEHDKAALSTFKTWWVDAEIWSCSCPGQASLSKFPCSLKSPPTNLEPSAFFSLVSPSPPWMGAGFRLHPGSSQRGCDSTQILSWGARKCVVRNCTVQQKVYWGFLVLKFHSSWGWINLEIITLDLVVEESKSTLPLHMPAPCDTCNDNALLFYLRIKGANAATTL